LKLLLVNLLCLQTLYKPLTIHLPRSPAWGIRLILIYDVALHMCDTLIGEADL
jgi:hypothetical protein